MNAYDATSPSDLLIAFLEGDLQEMHEDLLFSHLSGNPGLRLEMRELIAVNRLSSVDAQSLQPPSEWKAAVMSDVQELRNASVRDEPRRPIALPWFRTGALAVLTMLFGVLGTLGVQYLVQGDAVIRDVRPATVTNPREVIEPLGAAKERTKQESGGSVSPGTDAGRSITAQSASSPVLAGSDAGVIIDHDFPEQKTHRVFSASTNGREALSADSEEELHRPKVLKESSVLPIENDFIVDEPVPSASPDAVLPQPLSPDLSVRPEHVEIGYRNTIGSAYPNVVLPSELDQQDADAGINGASLSLLYRLDEHHLIGLETGRDVFPQIYRGTENGEQIRYEQKPVLFWVGAAYQYRTGSVLFDGLHPFVRAIAGGTDAGPLTKGVAGFQFIPERRVALTLGVEGSALLYRYQGDWFSSRSLDFTYGLSISF